MKKLLKTPIGKIICAAVAAALLAACACPAALAAAAPAVSAQSGPRSINDPQGAFQPAEGSRLRLLQPDTRGMACGAIANLIDQMRTGNADEETLRRLLADAPLMREGDELPPRRELSDAELPALLLAGRIRGAQIALMETEETDVYRFAMLYSDPAGARYWTQLSIEYDAAAGLVRGTDEKGVYGIGFDFYIDHFMVRAARDPWTRIFGFNRFYDCAAPLVLMYLDTLQFPFAYDGRDWMIQVWKGSYFLFFDGAEIGLYEKPGGRPIFWDASDTMLEMSIQLYQEDSLFFDYPAYTTWWASGYRFGNPAGMPVVSADKLRMIGAIRFEDPAMLDAFLASFEENRPANMTGSAEGLLFRFDWQASSPA